jgi:hypothetical protein
MSQHQYETTTPGGQPVCVTLGWDRRLEYFFMTVELKGGKPPASDEGFLYSNLDERHAFSNDLDYYRAKLNAMRLNVPESMFEEVASDAERNVGNRTVCHCGEGVFMESGFCELA